MQGLNTDVLQRWCCHSELDMGIYLKELHLSDLSQKSAWGLMIEVWVYSPN